MAWTRMLLVALLALTTCSTAFSGNFEITDLCVDSPFQVNVTSTENSTVSFIFFDQNTPECEPVPCCATWAVGLPPPSIPAVGTCSNDSVHVSFPPGTYDGVASFSIQISHTYEDDSVGQYPYNVLSVFAGLNLTYGGNATTSNYVCDITRASCHSSYGSILIAEITTAIA